MEGNFNPMRERIRDAGSHTKQIAHHFIPQRFSTLTKCFVCDEMIENDVITSVLDYTPSSIKSAIGRQVIESFVPKGTGCTCRICGVNVHDTCVDKIQSSCARVTHKFELRSYPPLTKHCYACGTTLQGLFNQGYQCNECGIICHPGCRTNINIKYCEAAPDTGLLDEEELSYDSQTEEGEGHLYEFVGQDSDVLHELGENPRRSSSRRTSSSWRQSLSKRLGAAVTSAAGFSSSVGRKSAKSSKPSSPETAGAGPIPIPASLHDMSRELRKLHTQSRTVAMNEAERWEREEQPRLKALRVDLTEHKKKLKTARDKMSVKVDKNARSRTMHYKTFAKKLMTKYQKQQRSKSDIENTVNELLELYSLHRCRENELLDELESILPQEAQPEIAKERIDGPCRPEGKLEKSLESLDKLQQQVKVATQSLEAVRRELFFPRWRHWFLRVGLEGTYVALGGVWLEQFQSSIAIRLAMLPMSSKAGAHLLPTVILALGGYNTEYDFDTMGSGKSAAKHRQKESENGVCLLARIDQLSVSGNALPMSVMLDELTLDLEFFLNIEMEYIASKKKGIRGTWRLKQNSFSLKFKRFGLNFKGSSLNVPDALLRTIVKNLITSAVKQSVKAALPPEFGEYMHFMHQQTPLSMRHANSQDQFRYHGRMDVNAELDLETLDFVMESSETKPESPPPRRGFMSGMTRSALRGATRVATAAVIAATGAQTGPPRHAYKDEPLEARVERALGLDANQIDLFIRTQHALSLTHSALFPDDSIAELGMKAIYSVQQDLQSTVDAAGRIGMRVLNGDILSMAAPLRKITDLIQYVLTYFGPETKVTPHVPRILALWQGALDKTLRKMVQSASFRFRPDELSAAGMGVSTRSLRSKKQGAEGAVSVRRIVFTDLVDRILRLARKRVITRIEMVRWDAAVGIGHLQKVARDKMLHAAAATRGGNAMVFQMKSSTRSASSNARRARDGEDVDDFDDDIDDFDEDTMTDSNENEDDEYTFQAKSLHVKSLQKHFRREKTSTDGADEDDEEDCLISSETIMEDTAVEAMSTSEQHLGEVQVEEMPFGEKQRLKEEQIKEHYAKRRKFLEYIRRKLLEELHFTIEASAGQGRYHLEFNDIEFVAPVDFQFLLTGRVFSNRSRINNWPWRRMVRVEESGLIHMAMVQVLEQGIAVGNPLFQQYSDPDDPDGLHILTSGIQTKLLCVKGAMDRVMGISVLPTVQATSWENTGKIGFIFQGEENLRFCAHAQKLCAQGGLELLHNYASDILEWSLSAVTDQRLEELARYILKALIRYASLNTFDGSLFTMFHMLSTENDLFLRASTPEGQARSLVSLNLQHDLTDFTDDIAKILEFYRTDPVDLGKVDRPSSSPAF